MMPTTEETLQRLAEIPNLTVSVSAPLSLYTRFGIGGSADLFAETCSPEAFIAAIRAARTTGIPIMVIGGGTNLIVSDSGFASAPSIVTITTANSPPVANAGTDQKVAAGAIVQLDGSRSTDVNGDALSYQWSLLSTPSGSTVAISRTTSGIATRRRAICRNTWLKSVKATVSTSATFMTSRP